MSKKPTEKKQIKYTSIPSVDGRGETCLTIKQPGEWFDQQEYVVFVGGCGVGHAKTRKAAENLLLDAAQRYCERSIDEARQKFSHYTRQLDDLKAGGLREAK